MSAKVLSDLGQKIFYDRYARKTHSNIVISDKVLAKHNGQSLFGTVLSLSDDTVEMKLSFPLKVRKYYWSIKKKIKHKF